MGDGNELEEVIVCVQGIIADMDLPPISQYVSLNYILHFLQVMLTCEIAEGSILSNVDIFGRELQL